MHGPAVLWSLGFRTAQPPAELNLSLRRDVLPFLQSLAGVEDTLAGCRTGGGDWEYVLAATVDDGALIRTMEADVRSCLAGRWPAEMSAATAHARPLATWLRFPAPEPARIVRVFEGVVREGLLDSYVEAARLGTADDAAQGHGPAALFLAADPPARFTTVSVWPSWQAIEAATGGKVDRPIATKPHEGFLGGEARHYELVADARLGPVELAGR